MNSPKCFVIVALIGFAVVDAATFNLKESIREAFGDDSDVPSWLTSLGEGFEQLNDALNTTNNRLSKLSKKYKKLETELSTSKSELSAAKASIKALQSGQLVCESGEKQFNLKTGGTGQTIKFDFKGNYPKRSIAYAPIKFLNHAEPKKSITFDIDLLEEKPTFFRLQFQLYSNDLTADSKVITKVRWMVCGN